MSFCTKCGSHNEDASKFCCNCGAPIELFGVKPEIQAEAPMETPIETQAEDMSVNIMEEATPVYEKVTEAEVVPPIPESQQDEIQINYGADDSSSYSGSFDSTQPQYYTAPAQGVAVTNGNKGFAIASLICGILSCLCCCFSIFSFILGVAAIALGIATLRNHYDGKGMAIAGIATGGVGVCVLLAFFILSGTAMFKDLSDEVLHELY